MIFFLCVTLFFRGVTVFFLFFFGTGGLLARLFRFFGGFFGSSFTIGTFEYEWGEKRVSDYLTASGYWQWWWYNKCCLQLLDIRCRCKKAPSSLPARILSCCLQNCTSSGCTSLCSRRIVNNCQGVKICNIQYYPQFTQIAHNLWEFNKDGF